MRYIASTNIYASLDGKKIFYQDAPPTECASVLIAARGNSVTPYAVRKYGLKVESQGEAVAFTPAIQGGAPPADTKAVAPQFSESQTDIRAKKKRVFAPFSNDSEVENDRPSDVESAPADTI